MKIDAPLPPWWRDVFTFTFPVPQAVADKIAAAGDSGLRAVCAVLDPEFGDRPVPRPTADARTFCAEILARFARPELVPWLFELMDRDPEDPIVPQLADPLAACGAPAVAIACDRFARSEPGDALRPWLADIAAHGGVRSDDVLAVLVTYLTVDPVHAGQLLIDYGDSSAVPALLLEFDAAPDDGEDFFPGTLPMLGSAIRALGGELDAPRAARLAAVEEASRQFEIAERRRLIEAEGFHQYVERAEPGDACPCESGETYGTCCAEIEAELAERHRIRNPPAHRPRWLS